MLLRAFLARSHSCNEVLVIRRDWCPLRGAGLMTFFCSDNKAIFIQEGSANLSIETDHRRRRVEMARTNILEFKKRNIVASLIA